MLVELTSQNDDALSVMMLGEQYPVLEIFCNRNKGVEYRIIQSKGNLSTLERLELGESKLRLIDSKPGILVSSSYFNIIDVSPASNWVIDVQKEYFQITPRKWLEHEDFWDAFLNREEQWAIDLFDQEKNKTFDMYC